MRNKNMKTIKELETEIKKGLKEDGCSLYIYPLQTQLNTLKDVLGLIDERIKITKNNKAKTNDKQIKVLCDLIIAELEELKKGITG